MRSSFLTLPSLLAAVASGAAVQVEKRLISTTVFNNLEYYAQYSAASLCNTDASLFLQKVTCTNDACPDVGNNDVTNIGTLGFTNSQAAGFVALDKTKQKIVVAIQGTEAIAHFIADITFARTNCYDLIKGCKLHTGFLNAWGDIKDEVINTVSAYAVDYPSYGIVFAGHSLGGAVGLIGAAYLRQMGYHTDVYSYGAPRVGNEDFVDYVNGQASLGLHYRVTHLDDYIPRLPPIWLGYEHSDTEYWISNGTDDQTVYTPAEIVTCTGLESKGCNGGTDGISLDAHYTYFRKISACK